ncbi:MAG: ectoine hydroxylase [Alphaproteobacteria bacterium]
MRCDLYPTRSSAADSFVPRHDPIIWSDAEPSGFVSKSDIETFERDGFLVLRDLLSQEDVEACTAELERLRKSADELEPETVVREPDSEAIRSIFRVHRQSPVFARLGRHPRLRQVAEYILGGDVYVMQSRVNDKPAFDGDRFDWHSDFETWHAEDGMAHMRAVSASVFLSTNTELNGPTMFIPGSHKRFVPCPGETPDENYRTSLRRQQVGVPRPERIGELADEGGIVAPSGPAGTVVLFDCNLLHASAPNMTPWPRSNAFFVFNSVANTLQAPYDRDKPRPEFLAEQAPMAA